jgi:ribonucleoside-diphosphate reductase alpha chain
MSMKDDSPKGGALQLSDNARTVLGRRYLVKDEQGRPAEGPEDLFWRVARKVRRERRRCRSAR